MTPDSQAAPSAADTSLRLQLRQATGAAHAALDQAVSSRLLRGPRPLRALLRLHAAVLPEIVAGLDRAGAAELWPSWHEARRVQVLLEEAGEQPRPDMPATGPVFSSTAAVWGAMWAVLGSRLGNRALARQLGASSAFLAFDEGSWPDFLHHLEAAARRMSVTDRRQASVAAATVMQHYAMALEGMATA